MHPAFEIQGKVQAYLDRRMTLEKLTAWLKANRATLLGLEPGSRALEIATALELGLFELDSGKGDFTQRHLRAELRRELRRTPDVTVFKSDANGQVTTSAADTQSAVAGAIQVTGSVVKLFQSTATGTPA
jgi:hypothetical protein